MKNFLAILVFSFLAFQVVNANDFCPKYATFNNYTSQVDFMTAWVNQLYNRAVAAESYTVHFFDGSQNGTDYDYTTNLSAAIELITGWVEYFASVQPFMCTDGSIAAYTNTETLDEIHDGMPIDIYAVKEFNQDMIDVLTDFHFTEDDLDDVQDWLDSLFDQLCNTDCEEYSSAFSLAPSVLFGLMAVAMML